MTTIEQLTTIRDGLQNYAINPLEKLTASGKYKGHVVMGCFGTSSTDQPHYDTVASFGGWLAIANGILDGEVAKMREKVWVYDDGANFLAKK